MNVFSFLKNPYTAISTELQQKQTNMMQSWFIFEKMTFMRGAEAAKLFYDPEHFTRIKATPAKIRKTLMGEKGIQGVDGSEHTARKKSFYVFNGFSFRS